MAEYSVVPPFREAKFFGVPSCVCDILGCVPRVREVCGTLQYVHILK
jgi:hypothetical protein